MSDPVVVPPPERIKADVEHIKDWLSKEPHLAHLATEEDEEWLETFFYNNKFSLEKTKYKLENLYTLRSKYPEIFKNRDPTGEDMRQLKKCYKYVVGDKPTKDGVEVVMTMYTGDPADYDPAAYLKFFTMLMDTMLLDKKYRLAGFMNIVNFGEFKPGHILKVMSMVSKLAEISAKAYSVRSKAVHVINLPNFAQKFFETMIKFFPEKLNRRVRVHSSTKSLFEVVDEDVVCSDFGGKGRSIAELEEKTQRKLEEAREWFQNRGNLCSNEEVRTKDSKAAQEMRGSFRKLEVD